MPGQKFKGVRRTVGKEGVFDFTEYEDVGLSEQVEEHSFDHEAFGEKAFERKKEALHTAMQAQSRAGDASAVKGSEATIESMMALVQQISSSSGSSFQDKPSATPASPVKVDNTNDSSSDSSTEDAGQGPSAGLSMLAPIAKKAAKAAASANKSSANKSGANKSAPATATVPSKAKEVKSKAPASGKTPTLPSSKAAESRDSKGKIKPGVASVVASAPSSAPEKNAATGMLVLDGRANRTLSLDSK